MSTLKIIEIALSVGETVNVGNYESVRVDASVRASVEYDPDDPGFDIRAAHEALHDKAHQILVLAMSRQLTQQGMRIKAGSQRYLQGEIAKIDPGPPPSLQPSVGGGGKW